VFTESSSKTIVWLDPTGHAKIEGAE
jgi:hypothetical protein